MIFGEIVEPTPRALILDDEEELPEYKGLVFEWQGYEQPPDNIENLIFVESKKVICVCSKITKDKQPLAKLLNEGLAIYRFETNYLVIFDGCPKNLVIGEIVEILSLWIRKAKNVHCITSTLISTFQPSEILHRVSPTNFVRCLTNDDEVPYNFCKRLEMPNLIQGLGAGVLTYCIHSGYRASLWIIYTDSMPVDSVNSTEIVRLFSTLGFKIKVNFKDDVPSSNLYM